MALQGGREGSAESTELKAKMTELAWNCPRLHFLPSGRKGAGDRNPVQREKNKVGIWHTRVFTWLESVYSLYAPPSELKITHRIAG